MLRRILVTGGGKGIGRAIALQLAQDGFAVAVHWGHVQAAAEATAATIRASGGTAHTLGFDTSDRAACRTALEADLEQHGPFYGAVLNAGIARDAAFPALTGEDWDQVLSINLDGFYNVLHPMIMPMIAARKGGRIVALSSVAGIAGNRGQVNYAASKAGVIGAAKSLAIELGKRAITVNAVAPGVIETAMTEDLPLDALLPQIPLRRLGKPEEVAAVVAFLCSDAAAYVTRQVISVNGGLI